MTDEASTPAHLLIYGFAPGAEFEGRLVGAIERICAVTGKARSWRRCWGSASTPANGAV